MKLDNIKDLTDGQLDKEIEAHKDPTERLLDEWGYKRALQLEKMKRLKVNSGK